MRAIVSDIASSELASRIGETVEANGGALDVLVNNAGSCGYVSSIEGNPDQEVSMLF